MSNAGMTTGSLDLEAGDYTSILYKLKETGFIKMKTFHSGRYLGTVYLRPSRGVIRGISELDVHTCVEECAICCEPLNTCVSGGFCLHRFHKECLQKWLTSDISNNSCPICRKPVLASYVNTTKVKV